MKKKPHRMGENICKWSDWQGIHLQNIQTSYAALYQKNKPIKKWWEDLNRHSPKKTDKWLKNTWKDTQHC